MFRNLLIASFVSVTTMSSSARADLLQPAWPRPSSLEAAVGTLTTYQSWDLFLDEETPGAPPIVDSSPDVANLNPNGNASVRETGNAVVTGSGNIYSPATQVQMAVVIPGYGAGAGPQTDFLIQLRTLGSDLVLTNPGEEAPVYDFSLFSLDGVPMESLIGFGYTEISRASGFGATVEHAFSFSVSYSADQFTLEYQSLGTSSSQDRISVDTRVVPEPGSAVLLALGLLGALQCVPRQSRAVA